MTEHIELHDSTLAGLEWRGEDLVVILDPAYVHRSPVRPGIDSATGWLKTAHIVITRPHIHGSEPSFPWELAGGAIREATKVFDNVFPVPFQHQGPIRAVFEGSDGRSLTVSGESLSASFTGAGQFLEFTPFADL